MLTALNTKVLAAILAALLAIGALLFQHHQVSERNAMAARIAAEKTAAILQQQRNDVRKKQEAEAALWKDVEEKKKRHSSLYKIGNKTYQGYLP